MVYCWREPQQSGRLSRPGSTTCRILATAADYNRKTPSLKYQPRVHTQEDTETRPQLVQMDADTAKDNLESKFLERRAKIPDDCSPLFAVNDRMTLSRWSTVLMFLIT